MRPLLVGELNPTHADPRFALYPLPAHASGGRLCRILELTHFEYLAAFDRVNLCVGRWDARQARERAAELRHPVRVLLGAKVAAAHRVDFVPFSRVAGDGWTGVVLPHPSGRCHIWNDPISTTRARRTVRSLIRRVE